ncbi:hypothetical protein [Kribbella sp. NPDC048915]|uniref:hypothetical protein n=1 Tax=Kribbella sp. NPDC048915 TaxID=3155148 RepID=UPI0033F16D0A
MKVGGRLSRLVVQITTTIGLLSAGTVTMLYPYLTDDERIYNEGKIDEVVTQGPATVMGIEWKLDSLKAYTTILNEDGEPIELDAPAGSTIVVAALTVTPRKGVMIKDGGFSCNAVLRDSKGSTWKDVSAYNYPLPTYCSDSDHEFALDKPSKVAKIFIVPKSTVPDLVGLTVEDFYIHRRVLITP